MLLVGYLTPDIAWYHDVSLFLCSSSHDQSFFFLQGVRIPSDDSRIKLFSDRRGYAYLSIDSALASDEGAYEIVAENKFGVVRHTVYLYLADPAMFLEPLQDARCRTHDTLRLECKVDGIPYPEV
jgi:hypothetical protein